MFKFWELLIEPILRAIAARRVVEVGVAYGQCTQLLLDYCTRVGGHLNYVDPDPAFDVATAQQRYAEVSTFHRSTSLETLPRLQNPDAVLLDGDHNWYTVYNELKQIQAKAEASRAGFPLVLFHDVTWPYGRRDLYYAPERVPEAFRQPYAQRGIVLGQSALAESGGLNLQLFNAVHEGGPRNGVLTAAEDFVAESGIGTLYVVPILFGLGILVPERLRGNEALHAEIGRWESPAGLKVLLDFVERERVGDMCYAHAEFARLNTELEDLRGELARAQRDLNGLTAQNAPAKRSLWTFGRS